MKTKGAPSQEALQKEIVRLRKRLRELENHHAATQTNEATNSMRPNGTFSSDHLADQQWQITFDAITDPICLLDASCNIIKCNRAFATFVNLPQNEVIKHQCYSLIHPHNQTLDGKCPFFKAVQTCSRESEELELKGKYYQIIIDPILNKEGKFDGAVHIFKDITAQKKAKKALKINNMRLESLLKIMQYECLDIPELLDYVLAEAIKLTGSKIGYIFLYSEEQETFTLHSWSKEVMEECKLNNQQTCFELSRSGVWGEAVRQRRPIIINDYANHTIKKGYTPGHVELHTFLTIPVLKGNRIVAVIGVANKIDGYNEGDILHLTLLTDSAVKMIERMKSEKALRDSEENFRTTMDNSPLGIRIVNRQNQTVYANQVLMTIYGFASIDEFNAPHPSDRYTPHSYARHLERMEKRKKGEPTPDEYDTDIIRKDGQIRHLHIIRKEVVWNGEVNFQVVYQDVTQRKQAEEQALILSRVTEQSPESIVITDTSGIIEYVNPKFSELTGYKRDELMGLNPRVLKSGMQSPEFYHNLWETILSGQNWEGELHNRKRNGDLYWEKAIISPIVNDEGRITHFVAVKEDITERKQMLAELVNAKERAEESDRLKSAFLANLSHEIRTPMNAILGFADLLMDTDLNDEMHESYINIIQKSGTHLLSIINDIIEISRIETGQITLNIGATHVSNMLHDIYHQLKVTIPKEKKVQLQIIPSTRDVQHLVMMDEVKVRQIIINLINNALKFTEQGHVAFGYNFTGRGAIEFFVEDTGIGIDKAYHSLIFERFRQVENNVTVKHGGSGLGLAISKAYVEKMGGSIFLESEKGKGSRFAFRIPYKKGDAIT